MKSKLPNSVLRRIWVLADIDEVRVGSHQSVRDTGLILVALQKIVDKSNFCYTFHPPTLCVCV